jgi:hypothetical protein
VFERPRHRAQVRPSPLGQLDAAEPGHDVGPRLAERGIDSDLPGVGREQRRCGADVGERPAACLLRRHAGEGGAALQSFPPQRHDAERGRLARKLLGPRYHPPPRLGPADRLEERRGNSELATGRRELRVERRRDGIERRGAGEDRARGERPRAGLGARRRLDGRCPAADDDRGDDGRRDAVAAEVTHGAERR